MYVMIQMISCTAVCDCTIFFIRVWVSLEPKPSSHVRERGSGVLNDFSCHSSLIWELKSDCRMRHYMRWHHRAWDLVCLQCSARAWECNNYILYIVWPRPMWQEMSLRTPDPLSTFRGRSLGTSLGTSLGMSLGMNLGTSLVFEYIARP